MKWMVRSLNGSNLKPAARDSECLGDIGCDGYDPCVGPDLRSQNRQTAMCDVSRFYRGETLSTGRVGVTIGCSVNCYVAVLLSACKLGGARTPNRRPEKNPDSECQPLPSREVSGNEWQKLHHNHRKSHQCTEQRN